MLAGMVRRARRTLTLTALAAALALGAALAQPAGWTQYELSGLAVSVPPGSELLYQEALGLILGHPDWERFIFDETGAAPPGPLVEMRALTGKDARSYVTSDVITFDARRRINDVTFDVYTARDTVPIDGVDVPVFGRILVGATPLPGGRSSLLVISFAGRSEAEAQRGFDEVLATLLALDPALTSDEIPVTVGLDGMLSVQIPRSMYRNWDRPDFFRIQTDDFPLTYVSVKIGDRSAPGSNSAVDSLAVLVDNLGADALVYEGSFLGEPGLVIEWKFTDTLQRAVALERCLPDDQLVLVEYGITDDWADEYGLEGPPFDTLSLTLPADASACSPALLTDLRTRVGGAPGAPGAPATATDATPAAAPAAPAAPATPAAEPSAPAEPAATPPSPEPAEPTEPGTLAIPVEHPPASPTAAPTSLAEARLPSEAWTLASVRARLDAQTTRVDVPLELRHDGHVRVSARAEGELAIYLRLIDVNGSSVIASDTSGTSGERTVEAIGLAPGTYTIRVERHRDEGEVELETVVMRLTTPDDAEPNDSVDLAVEIPHDAISTGRLGFGNATGRDVEDYFTITLPDDGDLTLDAEADELLAIYLRLIDVNGSSVIASDTSGTASLRSVTAPGLAAGTYYLRVSRHQGQGSYALEPRFEAVTTPSDLEPNDSVDAAAAVPHDDVTLGRLGYGNALGRDVEDYFLITLPDDGDLTLSLEADAALAVYLRLIDVNGSSVIASDTSGTSSLRRVEGAGLAAGTYVVRVSRHQGQGGYRLTPTFTAPEAPSDLEPNDAALLAAALPPIPLDQVSPGRLGYGNALGRDVEDYFLITLPDDGDLQLSVEAHGDLSVYLRLLDVDGSSVINADTSATSQRRRVEGFGLAAGSYFVRVSRHQGQGGYALTPTFTPASGEHDPEPNDHAALAAPIALGATQVGRLGYGNVLGRDVEDWFTITLDAPATLQVRAQADSSLSIYLRLYGVDGSTIIHGDTAGTSSSRLVEGIDLPPGRYALRVSRHQGQGSYLLSHETR